MDTTFTISTQDLSKTQVMLIKNHGKVARAMGLKCKDTDEWNVEELDGRIKCSVLIENFYLYEFIKDLGFKVKLEEY